jgi:hypothetical protein
MMSRLIKRRRSLPTLEYPASNLRSLRDCQNHVRRSSHSDGELVPFGNSSMFKGYAKRPFRGSTWTCTSLRQMMSGGAQLSKITTRSRGPIKTCMTVQSNAKAIHISLGDPLFFGTSLYAQPQDASPPAERTLWDHNGSIMYLIAGGSSRELHYQKPRPGMLEVGVHPDDVLFKGEINDGQISGTAYIFNAQCGQVPFHVKRPVLDNGGRIVLTGQAPRVGRNCQSYGEYTSTLEFKLLKTSEVTQPSPAMAQTPNVEEPTREQSPSDAAEPNLPNGSSAQPARTRQTPWIENPWPKAPPSGAMDPNLHGNRSAQTSPATQPNIEGSERAADAKAATTPSLLPSLTTSTSTADKNLLPPIIIALNALLPFLSIFFLITVLRSSA